MNIVDGCTVLYDGFVTIYFGIEDEAEIVRFIIHQGEEITLDDCKYLMTNFEERKDELTVIWETPLEGSVFRYGHYLDEKWRKCGKTNGYA